jgi:hypothetical protein
MNMADYFLIARCNTQQLAAVPDPVIWFRYLELAPGLFINHLLTYMQFRIADPNCPIVT